MQRIQIADKPKDFNSLPDYLIESYIFPYFNSKELFFLIRAVSPEWHDLMKNVWGINIKDEMLIQIKNISFIYEKDAIGKAYEFKLQYLFNYYNLLTIYNTNANVLNIIQLCSEFYNDPQIIQMLSLFFSCLSLPDCHLIINKEDDLQNKTTELSNLLSNEEKIKEYKENIELLLDINHTFMNDGTLGDFLIIFGQLNKEEIENMGENCKLIYSFLQGIIEYQLLKSNVRELKLKFDYLSEKILLEAMQWPKRKKFVETSYKFLLLTQSSSYKSHAMLKLFDEYQIKSPLMNFKEESYKMFVNLKEVISLKKSNLINSTDIVNIDMQKECNETTEEIKELILKNLLQRRQLLTEKIHFLEKYYAMYNESVSDNNRELCYIKNTEIPLKNFLISLVIASQTYGLKFNNDTILQIKEIIDNNYTYDIKPLFYNDNELEKQKEIQTLKNQKESLKLQKEKTVQVLGILKKYLQLKENLAKNKKKYKLVLYLLTKIRKGETRPMNEEEIAIALKDVDLEGIDFDCDEISEAEKGELDNFESTDQLLKEIEASLAKQINTIFAESKGSNEDNNNENENTNTISNEDSSTNKCIEDDKAQKEVHEETKINNQKDFKNDDDNNNHKFP